MDKEIKDLVKRLEVEISKTPTGDLRNLLCDTNIIIQSLTTDDLKLRERVEAGLNRELQRQKKAGKQFISDEEVDKLVDAVIKEELGDAWKADYTQSIGLSDEQINDLMVTALEGGINYWCGGVSIKADSLSPEQKYKYLSEVISLGGTLILEDAESDDTWELTKEKFLKGVEKTLEWGKFNSVQEMFDSHDAETVDVLIQYAIFDEITFG